jgi:hypothetical protein
MSTIIPHRTGDPADDPVPASRLVRAMLGGALRALEAEVTMRAAREESRGGFFAFLLHAAPRYLSLVDHLRAEHRELLREIDALRKSVDDAACSGVDVLRAFDELVRRVETHEELEREILRDAFEA